MKKVSKKIIGIFSLIVLVVISIFLLSLKKEKVLINEKENASNFISMMVEQEDGTYKENTNINFVGKKYLFNQEKSECENGGILNWNDEKKKVEASLLTSDKCYAYFDLYNFTESCLSGGENNFACDLIKKNEQTLYYHNGTFKDSSGIVTDASDLSYRYAGPKESVNNFVCLDGGATTEGKCANNDADLYRIIGLFLNEDNRYEIKLIKYDYATTTELGTNGSFTGTFASIPGFYSGNANNLANIGGYSWVNNSEIVTNEWYWEFSVLRKVNLNEFYLNYLKTVKNIDTDKIISNHIWKLNGCDNNKVIPKDMYNSEMGNGKYVSSGETWPSITKEISNKIGLMYISDYGFTVSPKDSNNWTKNLENYYEIMSKNWLRMGLYDWSISRFISRPEVTMFINDSGGVYPGVVFGAANTFVNQGFNVRPCFYLSEDTQLLNGDGSFANPYRIM